MLVDDASSFMMLPLRQMGMWWAARIMARSRTQKTWSHHVLLELWKCWRAYRSSETVLAAWLLLRNRCVAEYEAVCFTGI